MTPAQRWKILWDRIGAQGDARAAYDDLVRRYAEPHRAYHTLAHIEHCLDEFEQVRSLAQNPDAIEFALWYHDAIYDIDAKDNEAQSAALAAKTIKDASLSDGFARAVAALILSTRHTAAPADPDARFLTDIDLSILGQSEEKFNGYEKGVRKEYARVPADAFAQGRAAILRSFLGRPAIFSTEFFRSRYETHARRNIARSVARLRIS